MTMGTLLFRRLWISLLLGTVLLAACGAQAADAPAGLDPELEYNVTFETSEKEAKTLTAVHILETMEIGGKTFLIVILPGYRTRGFINVDRISAILPTKQGLATGY